MVMPIEVDLISQKRGCKRNLVWAGDFIDGKVVLILLIVIVALRMKPTVVDILGLGIVFIFRSALWGKEECLDNSVQVLLVVFVSAKILGHEKRRNLKGFNRSLRGLKGALGGLVGASGGPGLFKPSKEYLWSLLLELIYEGPKEALEAYYSLHTR